MRFTAFITLILISPKIVITITNDPMKIKVSPSFNHSIVITRALSEEIFPNPFTAEEVGNKWAIPQPMETIPPRIINIFPKHSYSF